MFNKSTHYEAIFSICQDVLREIDCDFVGFAFQNTVGPDIKWHVAAGNNNDKYKLISVRYGKGIAGRVISTGSPITILDFPNDIIGKALEYPIMLAEKLICSFAVPINYNGVSKGVLLVGHRSRELLTDEEQRVVQRASQQIETLIVK
jgi:nitrogen regulatory protein A